MLIALSSPFELVHFCQAIGRKPQSTIAFKKALDKLTGVYQSCSSSGMQCQGIQPIIQF